MSARGVSDEALACNQLIEVDPPQGAGSENNDDEVRRKRRRERNKVAAAKCREKKRNQQTQLIRDHATVRFLNSSLFQLESSKKIKNHGAIMRFAKRCGNSSESVASLFASQVRLHNQQMLREIEVLNAEIRHLKEKLETHACCLASAPYPDQVRWGFCVDG